MMQKLYHITEAYNLESILEHGLEPRLGPRCIEYGEETAAIYMFRNLDDVENCLSSWGEDAWDTEDDLAVIEVDVPENLRTGLSNDAGFEVSCLDLIPGNCITLVRIEPGLAEGAPSP